MWRQIRKETQFSSAPFPDDTWPAEEESRYNEYQSVKDCYDHCRKREFPAASHTLLAQLETDFAAREARQKRRVGEANTSEEVFIVEDLRPLGTVDTGPSLCKPLAFAGSDSRLGALPTARLCCLHL